MESETFGSCYYEYMILEFFPVVAQIPLAGVPNDYLPHIVLDESLNL